MKTFYGWVGLLVILSFTSCRINLDNAITSPDGKIKVSLFAQEGELQYSVSFRGEDLILNSSLGLKLNNNIDLSQDLTPHYTNIEYQKSEWKPVWGKRSIAIDEFNQLTVHLENSDSHPAQLILIFRAYNDGIAFRYELPNQPEAFSEFEITAEETEFVFGDNFKCFALTRTSFKDSYESTYDPRHIAEITPDEIIGLPLLVETAGNWMAVTEANLTDYAGMSLSAKEGATNTLISRLAPYPDDPSVLVKARTPHITPWRTIMIGESPGQLIETDLIFNLNEPNVLQDVSWIEPGVAIWPWWNNRISNDPKIEGGQPSTAIMKYYIDFAAKHGIPNLVVDAGWYSLEMDAWNQPEKEDVLTMEETRSDFYDIWEVLDYGQEKGIKVHLWVHLASLRGREEEVLKAYSDWGAAGIKLDNYGGDHQELVNELHKILGIAAQYKLIVDYHGAYKNTGIERTYPHYLTREAVLGMEWSKGQAKPTPQHNVTIPFTRMLAGPMDYTPGVFDLDGADGFPKYVQTTRAQQIAMLVVYFSPFQMIVDYPDAYEGSIDQFNFVKSVPTTWDDTRFIAGYPGDYIVLARRNGDDWFIGCMTDEEAREVEISLDFLDPGKKYTAEIFKDGENVSGNPQSVDYESRRVTSTDNIVARMAASGGAAIKLNSGQ